MPPISLPMLMFAAIDFGLSMAIAVLRFQHNLITGHRLAEPGWTPLRRTPEGTPDGAIPHEDAD